MRLLIALILCLAFISDHAYSQNTAYKFETNQMAKNFFQNRTFWNETTQNRYYFDYDGVFVKQYLFDAPPFNAGDTFYGEWMISNPETLCWKYDNNQKNVTANKWECHKLKFSTKNIHIEGYKHPIYLIQNGQEILLDRSVIKRLILDPASVEQYHKDKVELRALVAELSGYGSKAIPQTDYESLSPDMKDYYKDNIGKIQMLPLSYYAHNTDGSAIGFYRGYYDYDAWSFEQIKETAYIGRWFIKDNKHCWSFINSDDSVGWNCQTVYKDTGLDRPFKGYLTHVQNDYSRLFQEDNIFETNEMRFPELFNGTLYNSSN